MRNGDTAADSGGPELLPLEKIRRDLIDTQAQTACRLGCKFLQQLTLVRGPNVDHDVLWRQQIGDFHGRSREAYCRKHWLCLDWENGFDDLIRGAQPVADSGFGQDELRALRMRSSIPSSQS